LIVGENSTGKTTFLGCYSVLHRVFSGPDIEGRLDLNEQPLTAERVAYNAGVERWQTPGRRARRVDGGQSP